MQKIKKGLDTENGLRYSLAPFLFYRKLPSGATITGCHLTGGVRHRKNKGGDCYEKENGKCNAGVDDGTVFLGL